MKLSHTQTHYTHKKKFSLKKLLTRSYLECEGNQHQDQSLKLNGIDLYCAADDKVIDSGVTKRAVLVWI